LVHLLCSSLTFVFAFWFSGLVVSLMISFTYNLFPVGDIDFIKNTCNGYANLLDHKWFAWINFVRSEEPVHFDFFFLNHDHDLVHLLF